MQLKSKLKLLVTLICLLTAVTMPASLMYARQAGDPGFVALRVAEMQRQGQTFSQADIFQPAPKQFSGEVSNTIKKYSLLQINSTALNTLLLSKPGFIRITVPVTNGNSMSVLLYQVNISGNGFTLETSDGRIYNELTPIVHYRGIVENDMNSVASFSFSNEECMGLIANNDGNYVLGELDNATGNEYVFYNDKDLFPPFTFDCATNTSNPVRDYQQQQQNNNGPGLLSTNCVDFYYEIDYDIFLGKGSVANVNTYIQGVFNQVSTLYDNDGISITLLSVFVWTATDPYTGPSTINYLNQFGSYRTSFVGDLANLVGYNGGGGVAWLDQLCGPTSNRMSYSGINSTYNTVPTYSWTVEVITHEDGHLLGSNHTHDCVWNGNNTAIDGCGDQAGYNGSGSCATGPLPSSGTIMSYCHLVGGVGINFNNGFGPQPAARILNEVNNASCLAICSACQTPSQPGSISGNSSYCIPSTQTYSVNAVAGATSYIWTLPAGWSGTSVTNSITATQGTSGGTVSVVAVNACGNSPARTLTVTGNAVPGQSGNLIGSTSVCQGSTQVYRIGPVSGATFYTWTLPAGWSGSSVVDSIIATPGATGGTVSVIAGNSCGSGSPRTITVSVTALPAQPGSITGSATVCINTSYTYSVPVVPGATSYSWQLPSGWSGSSTTNSIVVVSGTTGGTISVQAINNCGAGQARTLATSIAVPPAKPGSISASGGNTKVCPGSVKTYSVSAVSGATSYNWTPPPGSTVTNGQGTTTVTVTYNAGFVATDTLKVTSSNGCATSAVRWLKITRNTPVTPGTISGTTYGICGINNLPYSVTNVSGITYNWSFGAGTGSVQSGQGTNGIIANFNPNFSVDTVKVSASNACGTSNFRKLTVRKIPAQPGLMTGTTTPCSGQSGVPYSIAPVFSAVSYTWTVPTGARIFDGTVLSTTNSLTTTATNVTVNFATTAGYVRVKANNACGTGSNRSLLVSFNCREASPVILNDLDLITFPNPADDQLHIQFQSAIETAHVIHVTDLAGKTFILQNGNSVSGNNEVMLDLRPLSPGIYFLEVINGDARSVNKISVQ